MKNRVILLSLVTWLCQISVWAQLEVDSLGRTIIHKELKLSGEEGSLRQSLFGKEGDFYWSDGFGGLKMTSLGKFFFWRRRRPGLIFLIRKSTMDLILLMSLYIPNITMPH